MIWLMPLLLSITILVGCEGEDLNTIQKEETTKETVQEETKATNKTELVKEDEVTTETEQPSNGNTFDAGSSFRH